MFCVQILIFLLALRWYNCEITIGGLFNETEGKNPDSIQELAFKFATHRVVKSYESENNDIRFYAQTSHYKPDRNSWMAYDKVCELMSLGVAGIFGPQYGDSYHIVQAICDAKEVPHIQTRWDPQQKSGSCLVNLHPQPEALAKVFPDIVQKWQWKHYLILYENSDSLFQINPLLEHEHNSNVIVKLQHIEVDENRGYRPFLRKIKESDEHNIVIDCSINILSEILRQAQQIGMMGSDYNFLITNMDFQTLDLEPYQYAGANITGIRFFDPEDETFMQVVKDMNTYGQDHANYNNQQFEPISNTEFPLQAALIYDAVFLFASAIAAMLDDESKRTLTPIECDSELSWKHGYSIINYMKLSILKGLTGEVKFNNEGFRSEFALEIIELTENGIVKVGKWSTFEGIRIERPIEKPVNETFNTLKNKTLTVVLALNPPYAMRKKSYETLSGNDQYEGFCVDLISEISNMNDNFSVNYIIDPEGKTGKLTGNPPQWNGLIGYIIRDEADLACADITINGQREEAVDITSPFMDLGIAVLYKKPQSQSPGFFSFLMPFNTNVWILVITAYVSVSLMFFIVGRISPYEWVNPFPCIQDPEELHNQFTLSNSFWFTIGALMQQGSEITPMAVSTRILAGVWWFFTLIMMVSCYTANLAAFLTIETPTTDFTTVEELASNPNIQYGYVTNGATETFFKNSTNEVYHAMYEYTVANAKEVITKDTATGVAKAEDPNIKYAFLMESSQIEYETERHCSLTQVGKTIDSKGYGIAMEKGSWYLGLFSQSILKMQEDGILSDLKSKWWKEKYAIPCPKEQPDEAKTLGLQNVGGVFFVLGTGVLVAILIAICEQLYYVWSVSKEKDISMKERLKSELKFFLRCRGTVKNIDSEDQSIDNGDIIY